MNEYEVTWSTYIDADDPMDAAKQVKGILQDPGNEAWSLVVNDVEGKHIASIDLYDTGNPVVWRGEA